MRSSKKKFVCISKENANFSAHFFLKEREACHFDNLCRRLSIFVNFLYTANSWETFFLTVSPNMTFILLCFTFPDSFPFRALLHQETTTRFSSLMCLPEPLGWQLEQWLNKSTLPVHKENPFHGGRLAPSPYLTNAAIEILILNQKTNNT